MSQRPPTDDLPTLTEVIGFEQAAHAVAAPLDFADEANDWARQNWTAQAEAELVQTVLTDVQRQIDHLFEYRVRESLAPMLARLTDALVREAREELGSIVRDVVRRAVAQELAKHRLR